MNQKFLTTKEAARLLRIGTNSLYNLVRHNKVPHYKPNKKTLYFLESELVEYITGKTGKEETTCK